VDLGQSCDVSKASVDLLQHIQTYVSDASLLRTQGHDQLIFTLPLASAHNFPGNSSLSLLHDASLLQLVTIGNISIVNCVFKN